MKKGFTLIELLIAIGILAIMATTAVLIINPVQYIKQSRDTRRIGDVFAINNAIENTIALKPNTSMAPSASVVYVSIPDVSSACANVVLPKLPTGYQYQCASAANAKKTDGTGWLPIDFSGVPGGSALAALPIDPINDGTKGSYYYYRWDANAGYVLGVKNFESDAYRLGGPNDKVSTDGGQDGYAYETGKGANGYPKNDILVNGNFDAISGGYSPGWNVSLNGTDRPTTGFASGYNPGVASPAVGYHAHANRGCGINNGGCLEYIDENTAFGQPHRWLGDNYTISNPAANYGWTNGTTATIRMMGKTNTTGKHVAVGLYHYSIAAGAYMMAWNVSLFDRTFDSADKWQEIVQPFAIDGDWNLANPVYIYIYGEFGTEGRLWLDNIELTYR